MLTEHASSSAGTPDFGKTLVAMRYVQAHFT